MPVSAVAAILQRALAVPGLNPAHQGRANRELAYLDALQGRFDDARELMVRAVRDLEERGQTDDLLTALLTFGLIEFFAEDYPAARHHMRASRELSDRATLADWSNFITARLAHLSMLEGNDQEALACVERVDLPSDDPWVRMFVGGVEARLMARRGETASAVDRARAMVAGAEAAGFAEYPVIFAPALEDLAEVLASDGQIAEAREVLSRVIAMQREKENIVGAAKAERALARITDAEPSRP